MQMRYDLSVTIAVQPKPRDYEAQIQRARELIAEIGELPQDWKESVEEAFGFGEPEEALFRAFEYAVQFQRPVRRAVVLEAVYGWFEPICEGAGYHYLAIPTNDDVVDWSAEPIDIRPNPYDYLEQVQRAKKLINEVGELPPDLQEKIENRFQDGNPEEALRLAYDYALQIKRPVNRLAVIDVINAWLDEANAVPYSKYLGIPSRDVQRDATEAALSHAA